MGTYAPDSIKAARVWIIANLHVPAAAVGIVGDTAHAKTGTSYHLGKSNLRSDSYSIIESSRDRKGLDDAASALDIGNFSLTVNGKVHNRASLAAWLVEQCEKGTADTADIREVIYSLDGRTVHRWDRLKRRTTGDSSHTYHTHVSYFRDSEKRDKTALFKRYLSEISAKPKADVMLKLDGLTLPEITYGTDDAKREGYQYVHRIQKLVGVKADGQYGPATAAAVAKAHGGNGHTVDLACWVALYGLSTKK
jgi:hypothetical protein